MKNLLKYLIVMVVLTFWGMAMASCERDRNQATQHVSDETKTEESAKKEVSVKVKDEEDEKKSDSKIVKEEKDKKEDTIKLINSRVDELVLKSDEGIKAIDANKARIEDIKGKISRSNIITWSFIALTLAVAIVALFKANAVNGRAWRHREELNSLEQQLSMIAKELESLQRDVDRLSYGISHQEDFSGRIKDLGRRLEEISKQKTTNQAPALAPVRQKEKKGYFGLPSKKSETEAYFKGVMENRDIDARFSFIERNNKAQFRILEGTQYLNDLKSNDAIKMAIDTIGCALTDATQMTTKEEGEAEMVDGRWMITKKTIILLH